MAPNLHDIALNLIGGFKDLTPNQLTQDRAPNCTHIFAPASLGKLGPFNNEQFAEHITKLGDILDHFPVIPKEVNVNEAGRQVVIWATAKPYFKDVAKGENPVEGDWDYTGEYIFMLNFDENGKVVRIVEFLDSLATERLKAMAVKARANLRLAADSWKVWGE